MKKIFLIVFIFSGIISFSQTRFRDVVKADPSYILPKANGGVGQVFPSGYINGQMLLWNGMWIASPLYFPSSLNTGEILLGGSNPNQVGSLPEFYYDAFSATKTFGITKSVDNFVGVKMYNTNTGSSSATRFQLANSANEFSIEKGSTGYSTSGNVTANTVLLKNTDGNMVFNNTANLPIIFEINNSEKFRMTSTGLGVLNNNPSDALDVTGNVKYSGGIKVGGSLGTNGQVLTSNGAGGNFWATPSGGGGGGSGTVTSVSVIPNNGVSAVVTNSTTAASLSFTLGNIYAQSLRTDSLLIQRDGNFSSTPNITAAKISGRGALVSTALELFSTPIAGGIGNTFISNAMGANSGGSNNAIGGFASNATYNTGGVLFASGGTDAIGLNVSAMGASGKNYGVNIANGDIVINSGRVLPNQGTAVASVAGSITLTPNGNVFEITGTSAITLISNIGWRDASEITLIFTSTATLVDGTANSGTNIGMEIQGNANHVATAGDVVKLVLCTMGGTQRWRCVTVSNN
jgi:hypothetical protein